MAKDKRTKKKKNSTKKQQQKKNSANDFLQSENILKSSEKNRAENSAEKNFVPNEEIKTGDNETKNNVHKKEIPTDADLSEKKSGPFPQEEKKPSRTRRFFRGIFRFFKIIFILFLILILLGALVGGGLFLYFGRDLPDVRKLKALNFDETTHIYDRNGHELYRIFGSEERGYENREYVSLKEINPTIIQATIAIEDKKFYKHFGFDPVGMVRAQLKNYQNDNISQGASTITQQLAKNIYLSSERTYERKIKEILLSLEIEYFFKKNEILELYFNKLSWGANAYGIEAASQTYFGVPAKDVSLVQASILAALPKTPSYYSPYGPHVKELIGYCKSEVPEPSSATQVIDTENISQENTPPLHLKIKAKAPVWIRIFSDGRKEEFTLKKDEEKLFSALNKIEAYYGNGEIDAFLNEQKISSIIPQKLALYDLDNWSSFVEKPNGQGTDNNESILSYCTSPEDPNYVFGRKDYVLQRMVEDGYITRAQMLEAWREGPQVKFKDPSFKIESPHFVFYVRDFLEQKYGKELVESGGLQVITSLDPHLQSIAEKAVADHADKNLKSYNANNAAIIALHPKNGQVLAMVGSRDFWDKEIDGQVNITTSTRQPGSAFKPLIYAAAIQNAGIGSGSYLNDTRTRFNKNDIPKNYDGKYMGRMNIRNALGGSRNIPAIKAYYVAGEEEKILDFVDKLGLTNLRTFRDNFNKDAAKRGWTFFYGWPMAIGSGEVKLLDLVSAYSTFANEGKLAPPNPLLEVRDRNGVLLDKFDGALTAKQVFDPQVAYIISDMLRDVIARPAGSWRNLLTIPGQNVAAKTGTSNKKIGQVLVPNNDLTIGYTPSLIAGIWVGNTDGKNMRSGAYSLYTTDPIYHQFFVEALKDKPQEEFPKPEGLKFVGKEVFPSWGGPKDFEKMFKRLDAPAPAPKNTSPNIPLSDFLRNTSLDIKAAQKMIDKIPADPVPPKKP